MRAITVNESGAAPAVHDDVPTPTASDGQVLVRVQASSANPVDNAIAAGMLSGMVAHEYPITLGRDYAGVVEQVGAGVTGFSEGDEVFGFLSYGDPVHDGTWAELIVVSQDASIARKPDGIDIQAAGAAPLAAVTAMACIDALELTEGAAVLVAGATGGVGSFAVQLAARAGATVIASALSDDEGYLRRLGVSEVVDRDGDVSAAVRERHPDGVEGLIDLVSYEPGAFDAALKDGARVASPNSAAGDGPGRTNVMGMPTTENLERLAQLLGSGELKVAIEDSYELDQAPQALQDLTGKHTRGKLAIRLA
jgi:NADPH:quinone reductase